MPNKINKLRPLPLPTNANAFAIFIFSEIQDPLFHYHMNLIKMNKLNTISLKLLGEIYINLDKIQQTKRNASPYERIKIIQYMHKVLEKIYARSIETMDKDITANNAFTFALYNLLEMEQEYGLSLKVIIEDAQNRKQKALQDPENIHYPLLAEAHKLMKIVSDTGRYPEVTKSLIRSVNEFFESGNKKHAQQKAKDILLLAMGEAYTKDQKGFHKLVSYYKKHYKGEIELDEYLH
jgi:hypothetical protein